MTRPSRNKNPAPAGSESEARWGVYDLRNLTAAVWGRPPPATAALAPPPREPLRCGRRHRGVPLRSCCYRRGGSQYLPDLGGLEDLHDLEELE